LSKQAGAAETLTWHRCKLTFATRVALGRLEVATVRGLVTTETTTSRFNKTMIEEFAEGQLG
jgi:hypothetical protein